MDDLPGKNGAAQSDSGAEHGVRACKKNNEWLIVDPYLIVGIIGASSGFAWFFAALTRPVFLAGFTGGAMLSEATHITFAAALLLAYAVIWICSNWFQAHRSTMLMIAIIFGTSHLWGIAGSVFGSMVHLVASACCGIGVAFLMTLWIEFVCTLLKGQIRPALAAALASAMLFCCGVSFTDPAYQAVCITALALFSSAVYLFLRFSFSLMDTMPCIPSKDSDDRLKITWKPFLLTMMASVAQGFALYWLIQPVARSFAASASLCLLSFALLVLLFVDSVKRFYLKESFIRRLFLPVLAACILSLFFLPEEIWVISCTAAFLFSLLPYASAIFATCEHIARCNLSAVRVFSWGRLSSAGGLLAGLLAGYFAFTSDVLGPNTLPVLVIMVVMFFILVSATVNFDSFYPGDEGDRPVRVCLGTQGEIIADYSRDRSAGAGTDCFDSKCDAVARRYGLSKRQNEVLHLLAKGRNADYIQNQLVISPHTAKAHIYNIYQKTNCHSHQDIIDLVENMTVDEEPAPYTG